MNNTLIIIIIILLVILVKECSTEPCLKPAPSIECKATGNKRPVKDPGSFFTPGESDTSSEYKCSQQAGTYFVWRQDAK